VTSVLERPGLYFWFGLSWRSASLKRAERLLQGYCRDVWRALGETPEKHIRIADHELTFPNGGMVWMRTADNPSSLAGEGVMGAVMDEYTLMPEQIWTEFVAASLLDHGGWLLAAGVPKGMGWSSRLFMAAKTRPGWKAWQCSSYDNPTLDPKLIDEMADGLPERLRRQEIFAEIIDDSGAVFRNVSQMATAVEQHEPIAGHVYVFGCDWGRTNDATVFSVIDATLNHMVSIDRMTNTDYEMQIGRLQALHGRFRPTSIIVEVNSMGQPLFERLQRDGLPVRAFMTSNSSKQQIIDSLTMAFEREVIRILPDEVLINELMAYESERLPSGLIRFGAPGGMHDDCVMSLALGWSAVARGAVVEIVKNPFYESSEFNLPGDGDDASPWERRVKIHDPQSNEHLDWAAKNFCAQCATDRGISDGRRIV
jgi:hypothetical protein